jgi:hypothetical protein
MPAFQIAIVNNADVDPNDLAAFVAAAPQWLARVQQYWPEVTGTTFRVVPAGESPASTEAQLVLAPNTTLANSLGYHTENSWMGPPVGIVELDACKTYNVPWTVTATHEIGELLINPKIDQFISVNNLSYPKEIADPVTGDQFLSLGGVAVSNVVTPAWFDTSAPAGSVFDLLGLANAPIPTIPAHGWLEWKDAAGNWNSQYGPNVAPDAVAFMTMKKGRRSALRNADASAAPAQPAV